jgi:thymidylate kinase
MIAAPTIVLVGPHRAGKTTLGKKLADRLGLAFDDEIGARLRAIAQSSDESAHALRRQVAFDLEVQRQEIERDTRAVAPRVVETWHVGNLAYALERNGDSFDPSSARSAVLRVRPVLVLPVLARVETVYARCSEHGADRWDMARFFVRVAERAMNLAMAWQLTVAPPIWTDEFTIDAALNALLQHVSDAS